MSRDLVKAMTFGGLGIQGIAQTEFYNFITSETGLSQLGIPSTEPPKLLDAYASKGFKILIKGGRTVVLQFGDVVQLKLATPHPADGTGKLQIQSWLEWILDDRAEDAGFVPRNKISDRAQKHIRLQAPLGGLMLPQGRFGSLGFWTFPAQFKNYDLRWFKANIGKIENAINSKTLELVRKHING